jgi:hypothetical protein
MLTPPVFVSERFQKSDSELPDIIAAVPPDINTVSLPLK